MKATVLRHAKGLILKEGDWCQGELAERADGVPLSVEDPDAVCFCAMGAILRAYYDLKMGRNLMGVLGAKEHDAMEKASRRSPEYEGQKGFIFVNDQGTHQDVLSMFDRAIHYAEDGHEQ